MGVGEFLLSEGEGQISRDAGVFAFTTGTAIPSGTVVGKLTANGKLAKYSDVATDGSQAAVGVLLTAIPANAPTGDVQVTFFSRYCEVIGVNLNGGPLGAGGGGVDADGKADLAAIGIIVR
jgi:predicted RecA/RadA family phage recombinase